MFPDGFCSVCRSAEYKQALTGHVLLGREAPTRAPVCESCRERMRKMFEPPLVLDIGEEPE